MPAWPQQCRKVHLSTCWSYSCIRCKPIRHLYSKKIQRNRTDTHRSTGQCTLQHKTSMDASHPNTPPPKDNSERRQRFRKHANSLGGGRDPSYLNHPRWCSRPPGSLRSVEGHRHDFLGLERKSLWGKRKTVPLSDCSCLRSLDKVRSKRHPRWS